MGGMTKSLFALCASAGLASAAVIPVVNHSFEDVTLSAGQFTTTAPTGWTRTLDSTGTVGTFYPTVATWGYVTSDGLNLAYMNGGAIEQAVGAILVADEAITLTVDVIYRPNFGSRNYRIDLLAGDTIIASDIGTIMPAPGESMESVLTYTPAANDPLLGQQITIRLGGASQVNFDNVRLDAPVPTPGSLALLGAARVLLARRRR